MKILNNIFDFLVALIAFWVLLSISNDYFFLHKQPDNIYIAAIGFIILVRVNDLHNKLDKNE